MVGTEGCWGLLIYIILLSIISFIECPASIAESACVYEDGAYYFERPNLYFS